MNFVCFCRQHATDVRKNVATHIIPTETSSIGSSVSFSLESAESRTPLF